MLRKFLFGTERQAAPNIQMIVRRTPQQSFVTGSPAALDSDGQANPVACAAELLTDQVYGLGLLPAKLDSTSWEATAEAMALSHTLSYLSVVIDKQESMRSFLAKLLAYYDGYLRWNAAGLLEMGYRLHNEAPPVFDSATTINLTI